MALDVSSTHIAPLAWAVTTFTDGPVLELGIGYNSTLLLHMLCRKRKLVSLDNNKEWAMRFAPLDNDYHQIIYTPSWEECTFDKEHWGVVFVDHAPALRRKEDIKRLVDKCDIMVIHDTEPILDSSYLFSEIFPLFPYIFHYRIIMPNTSIVSKTIDIASMLKE